MSWNEERIRAARFVEAWSGETDEHRESQTFWNEFFSGIFGINRRKIGMMFESGTRKHGGRRGFIDLFWPGKLLVEHKSAGKNLEEALEQAREYMLEMVHDSALPSHIIVCDFENFILRDLENHIEHRFTLAELPENIHLFEFVNDRSKTSGPDINPVNQKATMIMGRIYEQLAKTKYADTERFLTRLSFCMFADDAGIFTHGALRAWLDKADGPTTGPMLMQLFEILNTPKEERQDEPAYDNFPYVDGVLFEDVIQTPTLTTEGLDLLKKADSYDWSKINPAIFGGMFQVILDDDKRRRAGAHYTTEENILKVIQPLFLEDLYDEYDTARGATHRKVALERFQNKLAGLKFLDPACGSGNFLSVTYREIRRLELKVILDLHDRTTQLMDVDGLSKVDIHQFYGIEINEFSARIAEISMWMTDHMMNRELGEAYGISHDRLPLKQSANIVCGDALELDWSDILPAQECNYILGNPPYAGSKMMSASQREQVRRIAGLGGSGGTLDYVSAWFFKAAQYSEKNHGIRIGFVATSSVTQGELVGQMWPMLLDHYGLNIEFARRPFNWSSESPGAANVHVVILGLSRWNGRKRRLFDGDLMSEPKSITPYLLGIDDGTVRIVQEAARPLNGLPKMIMGSKPIDDGHYIFTEDERTRFLAAEPQAEPYLRPYVSSKDYINGRARYILALHDVEPAELNRMPKTRERVEKVKAFREKSRADATRNLAGTPTLYHLNVVPDTPFLLIPSTSSGKRRYVPMGFMKPPVIPSNAAMIIPDASLGLFGLLTSRMHMVWLAIVGGRLRMDLRYSAGMVYNTFPIPDAGLEILEPYAQKVLDARANHPNSTLADLYDPLTMPVDLIRAHRRLDKTVDHMYHRDRKPFDSDDDRLEFLLEQYGKMVARKQQ